MIKDICIIILIGLVFGFIMTGIEYIFYRKMLSKIDKFLYDNDLICDEEIR